MSSVGSEGSSRLSQFGLYRTIDARTEEFLRLSRKRQIKQGCVCAAISTAITVTVVIAVLLIYEYNVIANARKAAHKPTWLDLMNNNTDGQSLEEKFNRANINIDRTTLKLLPILLKALNHNKYIEKVKDEPTSFIPPSNKDTTEVAYKNIFADTRNWMKMPTSRLYAIEYKTSPIVYFKNPTRNTDYFTKIRKIRDYQRIMNYVDKMISEKNVLGSTLPMKTAYTTEKPRLANTIPMNKQKTQKLYQKNEPNISPVEEKMTNCKCPHKFSELINKLITSIQKLTSVFSTAPKRMMACSKRVQNPQMQSVRDISTTTPLIRQTYDVSEAEIAKPTFVYKKLLNKNNYGPDFKSSTNFDMRRDHTLNAIVNLLKPNFSKFGSGAKNNAFETSDTTNSYTIATDTNNLGKDISTQILKSQAAVSKSSDFVTTLADYILQKGTYDVLLETSPIKPTSTAGDLDGNVKTTPINADNFDKSDTHHLKLVEVTSESKNDNKEDKAAMYPIKGASYNEKHYKNTFGILRKMGNLAVDIKEHPAIYPLHRIAPISKFHKQPTTPNPVDTTKRIVTNVKIPTTPVKRTISKKNSTKLDKDVIVENKVAIANQETVDDTTLEEEIEKVLGENISKEIAIKHLEDAIKILSNETKTSKTDQLTTSVGVSHQWELVKIEENHSTTRSMIPKNRPTYLEMQRNDWKNDDDYDTNVNNYIFE